MLISQNLKTISKNGKCGFKIHHMVVLNTRKFLRKVPIRKNTQLKRVFPTLFQK